MTDEDMSGSEAPLIEHLAELRNRLINSAMAFIVAMIACFTVAGPIFNFLAAPVHDLLIARGQPPEMIFTGLQQGFVTQIRISLFGGFILAFPAIGYQMWRFVAPGLYRKEKKAFLPFLLASPFLFILGAAFAFYVVLPLAFDFFLGFQQSPGGEEMTEAVGITYLGTINEYLGLTMKFVIAFGLCFQIPVLLTLMGQADLVSASGLGATRKYAVVGILVLAAIVTPPDVITQVILFTVVYGLYEVSIILVKMVERKREARLRAEGYYDDEPEAADDKPAEEGQAATDSEPKSEEVKEEPSPEEEVVSEAPAVENDAAAPDEETDPEALADAAFEEIDAEFDRMKAEDSKAAENAEDETEEPEKPQAEKGKKSGKPPAAPAPDPDFDWDEDE